MSLPHPNRLAFREALYKAAKIAGLDAGSPVLSNNYVRFGRLAGQSDIGVSVTQLSSRVTLNNRGVDAQSVFGSLRKQRQAIDAAVGYDLDWQDEKPDRQKTVVRASVAGGYLSDRATWASQHTEILKIIQAFQRAFGSYL